MLLWRQDNLRTVNNIIPHEYFRRACRHRWTDPCRQRRVYGMMQCMTPLAAALCSVALLDARSVGAGSGVGDDGRKAAIQTLNPVQSTLRGQRSWQTTDRRGNRNTSSRHYRWSGAAPKRR